MTDRWIVDGDVLVRVHNIVISDAFHPDEDEEGCPFDVKTLAPTHLTYAFDKTGRNIIMGSWWLAKTSIAYPPDWTCYSLFTRVGDKPTASPSRRDVLGNRPSSQGRPVIRQGGQLDQLFHHCAGLLWFWARASHSSKGLGLAWHQLVGVTRSVPPVSRSSAGRACRRR